MHIEVLQMQKMDALGKLTGGVAHDFNNILASIMGYTTLALTRYADRSNKKLVEYLEAVYQAGERARDLISQMMTFSRSGSAELEPMQLNPIIKESVKMLRSIIPSSIAINLHVEPGLPNVNSNPVQIQQIIMNLCINARDAIENNGKIDIRVIPAEINTEVCASCHNPFSGDYVKLEIEDNGVGIDPVLLKRIFEPFLTTKEVGQGTGMGLSTVHGLVHMLDGHITVASELDKGTVFTIYLPGLQTDDKHSGLKKLSYPGTDMTKQERKSHILVIDDEQPLAMMFSELFSTYNYDVSTFTDSREAFREFERDPDAFDLVITDYTMPELSGLELGKLLLTLRPELPVILCSGYSENIDEEKASDAGFKAFFTKPINLQDLISTVSELI
jgi:CheY-like chemotaxis protein